MPPMPIERGMGGIPEERAAETFNVQTADG
jgi:hypothetical protein